MSKKPKNAYATLLQSNVTIPKGCIKKMIPEIPAEASGMIYDQRWAEEKQPFRSSDR